MNIDLKRVSEISLYIRYLSLLAVERAKSGHPGMPLGVAEAGVMLYLGAMNTSRDRTWLNRDRFVLSAGHGSMLLYALEYTFGRGLELEDIASFRALGSRTPGHPEHDVLHGAETTTGPLGQGLANAVGIAIQGKILAARFNTPDMSLFDYRTYCIIGDGCNMEGIAYEAVSIAGNLKLDNLTLIYDSNNITIDGTADLAYAEDTAARYQAMGWHVAHADVDHPDSLARAFAECRAVSGKPQIIIYRTVIGSGLNKTCASSKCHGAPVGLDEITHFVEHSPLKDYFAKKLGAGSTEQIAAALKEQIASGRFISREEFFAEQPAVNEDAHTAWMAMIERLRTSDADRYSALEKLRSINIPELRKLLSVFESKPRASREIFADVLQIAASISPNIIASSADLASSTKVKVNASGFMAADSFSERNIAFGIREHAMGAVLNGLALDGIFVPLSSTFQVFADYMRPAIRMASLMNLRHLFVFTHDSYQVGEDGPTHQPIEHINALRIIPGLRVIRPCNDIETAHALLYFMENRSPVALILSRQTLGAEAFGGDGVTRVSYDDFTKGAYRITATGTNPDCVLAASGHEVSLAIKAAHILKERGIIAEIVSMPSLELLEECGRDFYEEMLFRPRGRTFLVEPFCYKGMNVFFDRRITVYGIDHFGSSGHAPELEEHFGFTPEKLASFVEANL